MTNEYYPGMEFDSPPEVSTPTNIKKSVERVRDSDTFRTIVEKEAAVLVKFEADWCMPCKAMSSVVEEVANRYPNVKVVAINIEDEGMDNILTEYGVRSLPTFVHLKQGKKVNSVCGTLSKSELSLLISPE